MNLELVLQPILAGLSVGAFCLTYCFPFMGVVFGSEERSPRKNFLILLKFLAGRLAGYLCFGLLVGYLGEKFDPRWLRLATDISFIVLAMCLFLYLLGLSPHPSRSLPPENGSVLSRLADRTKPGERKGIFCSGAPFLKNQGPLVMGFFMGINLCPPFLLSVTYVFSRHSALYGMIYFAFFFLASSLYFLPIIFVGMASRAREFRTLARVSGFLVAGIFFIYGIYSILHNH